MAESYREGCLRHKYAEVPDEAPRHVKRKSRKAPKKADHRHEYENCLIVAYDSYGATREFLGRYCTICGKRTDAKADDLTREYGVNPFMASWFPVISAREAKPGFLDEARRTYRTFHFDCKIDDVPDSFELGHWDD